MANAKTEEQKAIDARQKLEAKAIAFSIVFTKDTPTEDLEKAVKTAEDAKKNAIPPKEKKVPPVLKNPAGKDVDEKDYFFSREGEDTAPAYFNKSCGFPVDREELNEVFNRIFNPSKGVLFYKQRDKEVYIIIVPLKYSTAVGVHNDSIEGDFQRHAISFLNEGSVNINTLEQKLRKVASTIDLTDK